MDESDRIEISKRIGYFKRKASIKKCLHPFEQECRGRIIKAHSIQNNRYLSKLEAEVNGQNSVYIISEFDYNQDATLALKAVGKSSASTFSGFCAYHDQSIFKKIEVTNFSLSREQVFLHGYRAFNSSYHHYLEWYKGHTNDNNQKSRFQSEQEYYNYTISALNELRKAKQLKDTIDRYYLTNKFDGLHSLAFKFHYQIPLAACGIAQVNRMPNSDFISDGRFETILITAFPEENSSRYLVSCFTNDLGARKFIDSICMLDSERKRVVLNSLLINYSESTVLSPYLLSVLDADGRNDIIMNIVNTRNRNPEAYSTFRNLKVDLLHPTFRLDFLKGINKQNE